MTGYGEWIHESRRSPYDLDQALDNAQDFSFADHEAEQAPYTADAPAPSGNRGAGAESSTSAPPTSRGRRVEARAPTAGDAVVAPIAGRDAHPTRRLAPAIPHDHPELERAAFRSALDRAWTSFVEGDRATAEQQLGFASRLLRGRVA